MRYVHSLMAAVVFLTRLPVPGLSGVDMAAVLPGSMRWFPLVGLLLGALATLPTLFVQPALRGLVYVLVLLWLTRGLHWDGFADLCDAAGSGAQGEKFAAILKDSRLGAFGGMGIAMGMIGEILLAGQASPIALLLAPAIARCLVLPLMTLSRTCGGTRPESTLCRLMEPGASLPWAMVHGALGVAAMAVFISPARAGVALILLALAVWQLLSLARRTGGINGDYHGAGIILGEMGVLLAATY